MVLAVLAGGMYDGFVSPDANVDLNENVSKATLGKRLRDEVEPIITVFSDRIDTALN